MNQIGLKIHDSEPVFVIQFDSLLFWCHPLLIFILFSLREISEKWKEMKNHIDTFTIKDVNSSNNNEYSDVTCQSN